MRLKKQTPRSGEAGESQKFGENVAHLVRHAVFLRHRASLLAAQKFSVLAVLVDRRRGVLSR